MRKIVKNSQIKFNKEVTNYLLKVGAKVQPFNVFNVFKLETIVGTLIINLPVASDHYTLYTVYSKFADVERAKNVFRCNPFSGKYNFHESGNIKQVLKNFTYHVGPTLKTK